MTDLLGPTQPATTRRTTAQRWTPLVISQLVAVLAVLLAGLGSAAALRDDDKAPRQDALSVVRAASSTALKASSFRMTFTMNVDGGSSSFKADGEFLVDLAAQRGAGSMNFPFVGRMEFVQSGNQAYMKLPNGKTDNAGHHWIGTTTPSGAGASSFGAPDPMSYLRMLATPQGVTDEGADSVNGTDAEHYKVRLDAQQVMAQAATQLGTTTTLPPGTLDKLKDLVMDVWIDSADQPRRMAMTMSLEPMKMHMTFNFLDYDKPVTVTVPATSDVTSVGSIAELGPALRGAFGS